MKEGKSLAIEKERGILIKSLKADLGVNDENEDLVKLNVVDMSLIKLQKLREFVDIHLFETTKPQPLGNISESDLRKYFLRYIDSEAPLAGKWNLVHSDRIFEFFIEDKGAYYSVSFYDNLSIRTIITTKELIEIMEKFNIK